MTILKLFKGHTHALLGKNMKLNTATPKQNSIFMKLYQLLFIKHHNQKKLEMVSQTIKDAIVSTAR